MGLFDGLFRRSRRTTEPQVTAQLPDHPQRRGLTFQVGNIQGVGGRERQEDSFALLHAADAGEIARRGLFAVVADGMGGLEDGKQISEGAVDTLLQLFQALNDEGDIPRQLKEGICAVSDGLFQRFAGRSGTTVVAVRIFQDSLHWVSVGDSAIFLMRNGGVFQVNREHTRLNELYLQELGREPSDKARAETDEDARRLSSFLGMGTVPEVDYNRRPFALQPGDVLLLCSDGISGVLTPSELMEAMRLPPDEGCRLLETMIQEKTLPGQDNFTGTMISIQSIEKERERV